MLFILLGRLYVVKHKDAEADENEGDKEVNELYRALLGEHKLGKENAEDGSHKAEDSNLGYGVELKEHTPECVCDSGKEGEVNENCRTLEVEVVNLATCEKSNDNHHRAAEHKLIAADNDGVFRLGEYLNKHGGECKRHCREENECVTGKVHAEIKSVKVNCNNARKAYYARNDLLYGELLLLEDKAGDKDSEEGRRAGDNSALCARGVSKTNVEEEILNNGLEGSDDSNLAEVLLLRVKHLAARYAIEQYGDEACSGKSDAGKKNGRVNVGLAPLEHYLVAHLDKWGCATPKRATKKCAKYDNKRCGKHLGYV